MSSTEVGTRDRGYDEIFDKNFWLHRTLGTFPFLIAKDCLKTRFKLFISTAAMVAIDTSSLFLLEKEFDIAKGIMGERAFKSTYHCPIICLAAMPIFNVVWLLYNKNKINEIFRGIRDIEVVTQHTSPDVKNISLYVSSLFLMFNQIAYYSMALKSFNDLICPIINFLTLVYNLSVLSQFSSFINIIQSHYRYISDTLYMNTAEPWCRCHDRLGYCCGIISDCYSPQLLLIVVSNFIFITTNTYQILVSKLTYTNLPCTLAYVLWMFFHILTSWYIIFCCSETMKKARKFDDLLYQLIVNDADHILLKNKRIVLHLKTKRKDEFSAMGFFKFDYPLLCSMVSSAVTYIIILVQFSELQ